ncbi:hypothetical protein FB451DRAFT_149511 [Mycena latifolia]|nr:hypothetical protein FB451DRAFT_149511 [Mycena latifolia]
MSGNLSPKRIQFHIDTATSLPLPNRSKKAPIAYVSVKITDIKDRLKTRVVKGQMNPTWQQNLPPTTSRLAVTDPYPLRTLLEMQGGNTFGTNIQLPLHAALDTKTGMPTMGTLSVNIRELTSAETARLAGEMAEKMSAELQKIEAQNVAQPSEAAL